MKYKIEFRRKGHNWQCEDNPDLYDSEAVAIAMSRGESYGNMETRVVGISNGFREFNSLESHLKNAAQRAMECSTHLRQSHAEMCTAKSQELLKKAIELEGAINRLLAR